MARDRHSGALGVSGAIPAPLVGYRCSTRSPPSRVQDEIPNLSLLDRVLILVGAVLAVAALVGLIALDMQQTAASSPVPRGGMNLHLHDTGCAKTWSNWDGDQRLRSDLLNHTVRPGEPAPEHGYASPPPVGHGVVRRFAPA